ncbi:Guanine nucleotide-binding protein subunit alpha [Naganishia adeliensis]|uniref:Guanine nucleotide-binding protein subunit alpha n=1 Tax=Naganishia adeliensis TaxID=92952 RepID=A0ACC2V9T7_9TREE|nr:Guanine nucleotide-binding protein subunit alpha [Naganishia adeliensis]
MGCTQSVQVDSGAKARNDEIESQLKRERVILRNEIKMLLLGAGESGKSTVLKQMRLIHRKPYDRDERESYREIILSNTMQSMRVLLAGTAELGISILPANQARHDLVMTEIVMQVEGDVMPCEMTDAIQGLWEDPGVRQAYARRNELQINDSASYYFDSIQRIGAAGFVPTDQDILRSRVKTTGISETHFKIGELTYRMFDVGGQRSERKKWIHCFESCNAIIFLVAISEYDQKLYEDESINRLVEALTLYDTICNSRWFIRTSIILFLNKIDIFREKLPVSRLSRFFPDYRGDDLDYEAACSFLLDKFASLNQNIEKSIYARRK